MASQEDRRKVENALIAMGLSGVDDPELFTVFAQVVEQFPGDKHWFFRGMLNECEPQRRTEMYNALRPRFVTFKPLPLDTYLAQIAEEAGRMVSHRVMRVEGPRPHAVQVGEEFYVLDNNGDKTAIRLVCSKCTRKRVFVGESIVDATIKARAKGWARDGEKDICPKCPKPLDAPKRPVVLVN